jgi:hypothetical protein
MISKHWVTEQLLSCGVNFDQRHHPYSTRCLEVAEREKVSPSEVIRAEKTGKAGKSQIWESGPLFIRTYRRIT